MFCGSLHLAAYSPRLRFWPYEPLNVLQPPNPYTVVFSTPCPEVGRRESDFHFGSQVTTVSSPPGEVNTKRLTWPKHPPRRSQYSVIDLAEFSHCNFFVRSCELFKCISRLLGELNRSSLGDIARQTSFEREIFRV